MVYRGKPSAGCENCRKAKKRCGLERPACLRCVKLNKTCSGYRDVSSLQIQDETKTVQQRAERQKAKANQNQNQNQNNTVALSDSYGLSNFSRLVTPELSEDSPSSSSPPDMAPLTPSDFTMLDEQELGVVPSDTMFGPIDLSVASLILSSIKPKPDDVASQYFFYQFTSHKHWHFLHQWRSSLNDPCLDLAIKACGMAALDNVENVVMGKQYARSMYAQALGMLNEQLRDPVRCKTDTSLLAVSMLGYYENLTCEGRESIQSWKAHIRGATQLLKLRGTEQFNTEVGRVLFREIRAQVVIQCLWDDYNPPDFLWGFQPALEAAIPDNTLTKPVDDVLRLCIDFGALRANLRTKTISDARAAQEASELESRFIQWSIDTMAGNALWHYYEIDVNDSEHVWNGKVHAYTGHPMPTAWNTWRTIRIMLSRTQEWLCRRLQFSNAERDSQMHYFRNIRRQMADGICATVPVALGHASPAYSSPCVLITAYGCIWPLFFAGTCAFERVTADSVEMRNGQPHLTKANSAAAAQALWVLGRLDYVSKKVGLRWADGVAATLRGDFHVYDNVLDEETEIDTTKDMMAEKAPWIKAIEKASRGPRYLIEKPSPLSDAVTEEMSTYKMDRGPIWLGRLVDEQRRYPIVDMGKDTGRATPFDELMPFEQRILP